MSGGFNLNVIHPPTSFLRNREGAKLHTRKNHALSIRTHSRTRTYTRALYKYLLYLSLVRDKEKIRRMSGNPEDSHESYVRSYERKRVTC